LGTKVVDKGERGQRRRERGKGDGYLVAYSLWDLMSMTVVCACLLGGSDLTQAPVGLEKREPGKASLSPSAASLKWKK
jgi:hypothetical protein